MNYIIIENEAFALENLKHTVARLRPDYHLMFTAESIEDSVEYLLGKPDIDLIFMDIELVDGNCFEIFRQVKVETPVIFTTAYDDFAIQAFQVDSIDYLLKPIAINELIIKLEDRAEYISALKLIRAEGTDEHLIAFFLKTAINRMKDELNQKRKNTLPMMFF